jgi:hypothetical protein
MPMHSDSAARSIRCNGEDAVARMPPQEPNSSVYRLRVLQLGLLFVSENLSAE